LDLTTPAASALHVASVGATIRACRLRPKGPQARVVPAVLAAQPGGRWADRERRRAFETIRELLLRRCSELVHSDLADNASERAVANAVYVLLRGDRNLHLTVDGWTSFHVIHETPVSLKVVGIMTILPSDDLPLELELSRESNGARYLLRIGLADERWQSLSESKRWKSVYLYATQDRDVDWTWSEPLSGHLSDQ
jgi:hypothetical protein